MSTPAQAFRRTLRLHDVPLEVAWSDPALADAIQTTLEVLGIVDAPPRPDALMLRIVPRDRGMRIPPDAALAGETPEGLTFSRAGDTLYLELPCGFLQLAPRTGRADIVLDAIDAERAEAVAFLALFYSLVVLLFYRGRRTMHAGGVVGAAGTALIVGGSGSGKSTLTLRLAQNGWRYLSDDSVLLHKGRGRPVEVLALRRDFCLDPEDVERFPEVANHWRPFKSYLSKQRVDASGLFPGREAERALLSSLVFPRLVPDAATRLEPLSAMEAVFRLMEQSGTLALLDKSAAAEHMDFLKAMARHVPCYELVAGPDLLEDDRLVQRIGEHLCGPSLA